MLTNVRYTSETGHSAKATGPRVCQVFCNPVAWGRTVWRAAADEEGEGGCGPGAAMPCQRLVLRAAADDCVANVICVRPTRRAASITETTD